MTTMPPTPSPNHRRVRTQPPDIRLPRLATPEPPAMIFSYQQLREESNPIDHCGRPRNVRPVRLGTSTWSTALKRWLGSSGRRFKSCPHHLERSVGVTSPG